MGFEVVPISSLIIAFVTVIILYKTIQNNVEINQNVIFNELVKQERELRIKLAEYRKEIHEKLKSKNYDYQDVGLDYDTLLFNFYEFLAVCVYKKLVNEKDVKFYFRILVESMRQKFEDSILFREDFARKRDYKTLIWLFRRWKIEY